VGLAAAWRLGIRGCDVVLFDRFEIGHDRGSSHGATRIFRFAYDDPVYVELAQRALPLWRGLEEESETELVRITGGLDIGDDAYLESVARALSKNGATVERMGPHELRDRFPWLEVGEDQALHSPDTGVIGAADAVNALARAAVSRGVRIVGSTPVEMVMARGDGVELDAGSGPIQASCVVVAAGAWVSDVVAPLGISMPERVTREQVFYFSGGDEMIPFIHRGEIARYGVPPLGNAAGYKVAEHGTGAETTADSRNFEIEPGKAARLKAYVRDALPSLDPEPVAAETCLYTMTPDEGFVLDVRGPVVVASACSGHGFKFAPIVGEIIAALATDEEPPVAIEPFSLSRF
jgi:sarcosine oxidase